MAQIRNAKPIVQTVRLNASGASAPAASRSSGEFGGIAALWGAELSPLAHDRWFEYLSGYTPCIDLDEVRIDGQAVNQVAQEVAAAFQMMPLRLSGPGLLVAVPQHCDLPVAEISRMIGMEVRFVWADAAKIRAAINQHYGILCAPA